MELEINRKKEWSFYGSDTRAADAGAGDCYDREP